MRRPTVWTPERVERLRALAAEGLETADIARRMKRTRNAIISAARVHEIRLRPRGRGGFTIAAGAARCGVTEAEFETYRLVARIMCGMRGTP